MGKALTTSRVEETKGTVLGYATLQHASCSSDHGRQLKIGAAGAKCPRWFCVQRDTWNQFHPIGIMSALPDNDIAGFVQCYPTATLHPASPQTLSAWFDPPAAIGTPSIEISIPRKVSSNQSNTSQQNSATHLTNCPRTLVEVTPNGTQPPCVPHATGRLPGRLRRPVGHP